MRRKMAGLLAILFVMMTVFTGCSASGAKTVNGSAEAMNIDGVTVPLGEVNFYLRYQQASMQTAYGGLFGETFMSEDMLGLGVPYGETIRDSTVDTLQEFYLVEAHAEELGVSLSDEEKAAAAEAAKTFIANNDKKAIEAMSADEATVTHVLELIALQSKVYDDRAATIDTEVDQEEIAQKRISYVMLSTVGTADEDGNATELTEEELTERRTRLEGILAAAKESGDLDAAAEAEELTAVTTTYGKDDTVLTEMVRNAADELEEGEYSEVIEAENGYFIIYMESTFDENATETKRQSVLSSREREAYSEWLSALEEAAVITVNDEVIQTLSFERIFEAAVPEAEE